MKELLLQKAAEVSWVLSPSPGQGDAEELRKVLGTPQAAPAQGHKGSRAPQ